MRQPESTKFKGWEKLWARSKIIFFAVQGVGKRFTKCFLPGWANQPRAYGSDEPVEDEHLATGMFECPGYVYIREISQELFQNHTTTVSQFVNQPQRNRLAQFLTWIKACRINKA